MNARQDHESSRISGAQAAVLPSRSPTALIAAVQQRPLVYLAVGLSIFAGQVHAWIVPEQLVEQPQAGVFFLVVAFAQSAYAAALLDRPRSSLLLAFGLAATVGLLVLLVWAHTAGLPFGGGGEDGHDHVHAHPFDLAAQLALVSEAGLVLALGALLARASRSPGGAE